MIFTVPMWGSDVANSKTEINKYIKRDTAWQIVALTNKFDNPSTSFSVSDDLYVFPPLEVCFWEGKGCDENLNESTCVASVASTVYDPCSNVTEDIEFPSQWTNCVAFSLSDLDMQGFEDGCSVLKKPSTVVTMAWYSSYAPFNETSYREIVGIFLGNESTPEYVTVPYRRVVVSPGSDFDGETYVETDLTIGKTTRNFLSGTSETSYPILTLSTGDHVEESQTYWSSDTDDNSSFAVGFLHLTITQGAYSLTELNDINPLDIGTLLGNIGGFWELLLVTWGLCFIAAKAETPATRGRDFTKPIKKGKEIVTKKRRSSSIRSEASDAEEQPYWSSTKRGRGDFSGGSIRVIPPVGSRPPMNVAASFFRRPVLQDQPRRSISGSGRSVWQPYEKGSICKTTKVSGYDNNDADTDYVDDGDDDDDDDGDGDDDDDDDADDEDADDDEHYFDDTDEGDDETDDLFDDTRV
eukprot:jgi/Undpi1/13615/HiC_scaffold_9.g03269.m1